MRHLLVNHDALLAFRKLACMNTKFMEQWTIWTLNSVHRSMSTGSTGKSGTRTSWVGGVLLYLVQGR